MKILFDFDYQNEVEIWNLGLLIAFFIILIFWCNYKFLFNMHKEPSINTSDIYLSEIQSIND